MEHNIQVKADPAISQVVLERAPDSAAIASASTSIRDSENSPLHNLLHLVSQFRVENNQLYVVCLPAARADIQNHQLAPAIDQFLNGHVFSNQTPACNQGPVSVVERFEAGSMYYAIAKSTISPQSTPFTTTTAFFSCHQNPFDCESLQILLTAREQEIICLIAVGLTNKQIASRLDISIWTVSAHLRRIFHKLRVDTRAAVVYRCAPLLQSWEYHKRDDSNLTTAVQPLDSRLTTAE